MTTFGKVIKEKREQLELSQEQLANKIAMPQTSLSKIERGLQEPNLHQLRQLALNLRLSLDEVFDIKQNLSNSEDKETLWHLRKYVKEHTSK